jgi:hypothetical protein
MAPAPGVAAFSLAHFRSRAEAPSAKPLSGRQTKPNKSKENQEKRLGFPWIPLAESWFFKGLQRIQVKKIPFPLRAERGFSTEHPLLSLANRLSERWVPRIEICISLDFGFVQKMPVRFCLEPSALEFTRRSPHRASSPFVGEDRGGGCAVLRDEPAMADSIISLVRATPHP